jgi:hypothetical protein
MLAMDQRVAGWLINVLGVDLPDSEPDSGLVEEANTAALLEAWLFLQQTLPAEWHDAGLEWLQRVAGGSYLEMAEEIVESFQRDGFVARPVEMPEEAAAAQATSGDAADRSLASRVERFDIRTKGDERLPGEGSAKEWSLRAKHLAEQQKEQITKDAANFIYGGKYFAPEQQDEWTARTIRSGEANLLCYKSGDLIHSPDDPLNFVVVEDPDYPEGKGERLILCPEKHPVSKTQYSSHGQLARGGPVKYAGEMFVREGTDIRYNLKAGHYRQPTQTKADKLRDDMMSDLRDEVRQRHGLMLRVKQLLMPKRDHEAAYLNRGAFRERTDAIDEAYKEAQEKAGKFGQYLAEKLGVYVPGYDPDSIDDDVSTVNIVLEKVSPTKRTEPHRSDPRASENGSGN